MSEIRSQATPARDDAKREMLTRLGMIHLAERYGTRLRLEPSHDNEIRVDITHSGGTESHFPDALDLLESVEAVVEHMGLRKPRTVKFSELGSLPIGVVVRNDEGGTIAIRESEKDWFIPGLDYEIELWELENPEGEDFTVLFTPGEAG